MDNERFATDNSYSRAPAGRRRPRPKKGMSSVAIVALILVGFGLAALLVCGGGVFYFYQQFDYELEEDPQAVIAATDQMADIDIPEAYEPESVVHMNMVFMTVDAAIWYSEEIEAGLLLAEMKMPFGDLDDAEREFRETMDEKLDDEDLIVLATETRDFQIRGETVPFQFAHAENVETGELRRQATGTFSSRDENGLVFLHILVAEEHYEEDAVVAIIESIR